MAEEAERANLGVSTSAPVPGANALGGSAGNEGDAGPVVPVRGLELQGPQRTNAAQHHWQHKAVQPACLCTSATTVKKLARTGYGSHWQGGKDGKQVYTSSLTVCRSALPRATINMQRLTPSALT